MGLEQRIPYPLDPDSDLEDPFQAGMQRWATQPPIGCQYVDASSTFTTLSDGIHSTIDLLTTAGNVKYDPYGLIDLTNNRIGIPFPGIWDITCEVLGTTASTSCFQFSQVTQGAVPISTLNPMIDFALYAAASIGYNHLMSMPLYVDRAWIANNQYLYIRGLTDDLAGAAAGFAKVKTFSMWLRSAFAPSKY